MTKCVDKRMTDLDALTETRRRVLAGEQLIDAMDHACMMADPKGFYCGVWTRLEAQGMQRLEGYHCSKERALALVDAAISAENQMHGSAGR